MTLWTAPVPQPVLEALALVGTIAIGMVIGTAIANIAWRYYNGTR